MAVERAVIGALSHAELVALVVRQSELIATLEARVMPPAAPPLAACQHLLLAQPDVVSV